MCLACPLATLSCPLLSSNGPLFGLLCSSLDLLFGCSALLARCARRLALRPSSCTPFSSPNSKQLQTRAERSFFARRHAELARPICVACSLIDVSRTIEHQFEPAERAKLGLQATAKELSYLVQSQSSVTVQYIWHHVQTEQNKQQRRAKGKRKQGKIREKNPSKAIRKQHRDTDLLAPPVSWAHFINSLYFRAQSNSNLASSPQALIKLLDSCSHVRAIQWTRNKSGPQFLLLLPFGPQPPGLFLLFFFFLFFSVQRSTTMRTSET